jgi:diguanylate cyclase (GGDEF)-like protein/PAS domain S-box-containing protein
MAILTVANFLLPSQHVFIWTAIGLSSVAAVGFGTWHNAPRHRLPWILLAAAIMCLILGDLTADLLIRVFHQDDPFPSVADLAYLLMYPLIAAGMYGLYRRGVVRRDAAGLLDALTLTAGVALLSWIFLIGPYVENPNLTLLQKSISIGYPLGDIMILAVGARLIASAHPIPALTMLAIGGLGLLTSDVAYGWIQLNGTWRLGTPVDLGWVAFYVLWGAAALHPSMRELTEPKVLRQNNERLRRLVLLGLASLIAPTVLLVEVLNGDVHDGAVIAVLSAILSILVLIRLGRALRIHSRVVERERGLRRAGAALLMATDVTGVTTVVRDAVRGLLPPGRPHRVVLETANIASPASVASSVASHQAPYGNVGGADQRGAVGGADQRSAVGGADQRSAFHRYLDPSAPTMAMLYTGSLPPRIRDELGGFEVTLRCRMAAEERRTGTGRLGALYIAADEVSLVALQEAAQVLATQAALALERLVLSNEIDRRNSEAYFRTLVLNTADVILIVGDDGDIRYASPSAAALFLRADLVGTAMTDLVDPDSVVDVRRRMDRVRNGRADHHDRDWKVRRVGDRRALVEVSLRDLHEEPTVNGLVLTLRDVTESRRLEDELYQRATFDNLTGLPNREVFIMGAQDAIESAGRNGATVGVVVIELDDFKMVNNTMGHGAGDELLVAVGQRLAATMRSHEAPRTDNAGWLNRSVARLGGDEFAVLIRYTQDPAEVERMPDQIMQVFDEPFTLRHGVVTAGASAGVATTDSGTTGVDIPDAQELLRQADLAVYVAKDAGKGRWLRYEASLHTAVVDRLKLRSDLERAVADGSFLLHYQPIVALDTGQTSGFEALVRWNHPTRGMLPPLQFIDLAEESGLIVPLGAWVLHHAIEAANEWRRLRPERSLYVSVNVSARQFRAPGFVEDVRRELAQSGLPHECLTLEITESLLVREGRVVADELNTLRREGVRVAIDDFGTGFSSLSYLRQLPVDVLKLDKSFIDTIISSPEQYAVVDAIISLAGTLRLAVIAEGIETIEELNLLVSMGCGYGQGYLLSRPVSYGDAIRWLMEDTSTPVGVGGTAA